MINAIDMGKRCIVYEVRKATVSNGYIGCRRVVGPAGRIECPPPTEKSQKKDIKKVLTV